MTWVDSHCHLNLIDLSLYNNDIKHLVERVYQAQVEHILCVGIDLKTMPSILALSEQFEFVYASIGIHPSDVGHEALDESLFLKYASFKRVIAVGETGLDYYHSIDNVKPQQLFFKKQIALAKRLKKPLVIHSRESFDDTLSILKETNAGDVGGVLHCFTGDYSTAKKAIDMGFHIGVSGIVTFKNASILHEVVKKLPLKHMLLETDSPWLAPAPYRGTPNTPEDIPYIGRRVAELKNLSIDEVAFTTSHNFFNLFYL